MKTLLTAMLLSTALLFLTAEAMSQTKKIPVVSFAANQPIRVIEMRNYILKPGQRDNFISFFESNFIDSQNSLGGYVLGQFRVKGADDNFFWIRGFNDMPARSQYLPAFYRGEFWKQRRSAANAMIVNNDNVYLLKPLILADQPESQAINSREFGNPKGLAVVDYYIANTRLNELTKFFEDKYLPLLKSNGINDMTVWVSELAENDFPGLPVFQDKNLLVTIAFYKNEAEYRQGMDQLNSPKNNKIQNELREIMTTRSSTVLYPTNNSFSNK